MEEGLDMFEEEEMDVDYDPELEMNQKLELEMSRKGAAPVLDGLEITDHSLHQGSGLGLDNSGTPPFGGAGAGPGAFFPPLQTNQQR